MRVKALKLELGKDLKLQASGIWTQLWDQNCETCKHPLPTPRMERIKKAQIDNCKHHQIKRLLQDHVASHSLLWEVSFNFIWSLLQDRMLRKTCPACLHGGFTYGFIENPPHQFWALELNSFQRKLRRGGECKHEGVCFVTLLITSCNTELTWEG